MDVPAELSKLVTGYYNEIFAQYEEQLVPVVEAVNAINATQIEIKFNKAIDKDTVLESNGDVKVNAVSLRSLDGLAGVTLKGQFSADGKTLTVTSSAVLEKRYDIEVKNVKTTKGQAVEKFTKLITVAADTTAPTIVSTTKLSAGNVKVSFSEPIKSLGNVSYKLANGTVVAGTGNGVTHDFVAGAKEVTFTLGSDIAAGREVIATFIGAQDQAGNLLTPNPATVSMVKGNPDGVAPTVSSITQTGATTFAVKFSEELSEKPVIEIDGVAVATAKIAKDNNDPTVYVVTADAALDGVKTIGVKSITDLSGENGTDMTRVVTFVKETAAPKAISSTVVTDATNKKEYLEIAFDKDVNLTVATVAISGSYIKGFVTNSIADGDVAPSAVSYKTSPDKKVVRVDLATLLGGKNVKGATYSLNLTFAGVASASGVAAEAAKTSFVRGEDGTAANTDLVGVSNVEQGDDNNKVEVTFDKPVDGASATTVANYRIDGAVVESVTLKPVAGGSQVAVLNLKANSNGFTGTRNINIANVKALGSNKVMDPYFINNVSLNENVAPTVTSAKLIATDKVVLTFSEAITDGAAEDFEVLVGGKSQALAEKIDVGAATATTTVTVTIDQATADKLSKGLSFKALDTLDVVDAAGNKLSVPSNISISN